ncbi:MAG: tripartite tricarboxylate transporter TctB family protein [Alphaproteobacteria bacterium]|nr:tripartite tricarboxylate transporter TctB family protein [Alphaproteobacteria bacterium]
MNLRIPGSSKNRGPALVGTGVVVFALVVLWQTTQIPVSPLYSKVSPTIFPYMVAGGLLLLGLALIAQAWRGEWGETDAYSDDQPTDRRSLGWLALGLILNVALIDALGFVIASTLLFVCTARAFGSLNWKRDLGIAVALALIAYLGFAKLLGISIGAGVLEGIL